MGNQEIIELNNDLLKCLCRLLIEVGKQDDTRPTERRAIAKSKGILDQHVTKEFIEAIAST